MGLDLAIARRGALTIDEVAPHTIDKALRDGAYYSDKAPGTAFTALPIVGAAVSLARLLGHDVAPVKDGHLAAGYFALACLATIFTSSLFTALAAAALYRLAREWRASRAGALFAALAFGLATPAAGQATLFFGHALCGACLFLAFALASMTAAAADGTKPRRAMACAAGALLAWATVVEFTAAPAALVIALDALGAIARRPAAERRAAIGWAVAGGAGALLPLLAYDAAAFGSPFAIGYGHVVGFERMGENLFGVGPPRAGIMLALLAGAHRGILWIAPILLLWPAALWCAARRLPARFTAVLGLVPVLFLLINSGYAYWDGGWSTGPRFLTPGLAFAALPLAFLWDRVGRAGRVVLAALASVSAGLSLVCAAVDMTSPAAYANPLLDHVLPDFGAGRIHNAITVALWILRGLPPHGFNEAPWIGLATMAAVPAIWLASAMAAMPPRRAGRA
jgi:hypothetical protein